tara:strand:- start:12 stop:584 length:573 start_codon:yes stop_codon:yes gene_type:complete
MERFIQLINQTNQLNNERMNIMNIIQQIETEVENENNDNENNDNENNEESPNAPAQENFIQSLKEIEMKQENVTCSLCLEDFKMNEKCICLPCKDTPHYFHAGNDDCPGIFEWFKKKNTCPICRFEFPKEEPEESPNPQSPFLAHIIFNHGDNNMNEFTNNILNSLQNTLLRREEERQLDLAIQASINDQ